MLKEWREPALNGDSIGRKAERRLSGRGELIVDNRERNGDGEQISGIDTQQSRLEVGTEAQFTSAVGVGEDETGQDEKEGHADRTVRHDGFGAGVIDRQRQARVEVK